MDMPITTDPNDPRLQETSSSGQQSAYLVLSEEERAKGFVRPLRRVYRHVGRPEARYPLRALSEEERERFKVYGYVAHEAYPESESPVTGRYWTQAQLDAIGNGCGGETIMAPEIAETYARDPKFYGSTYCMTCRKHLPVEEFVWPDGTRLGS